MSRLELAKTELAKKVDTPKMVATKVEGTFPDLPWGGAQLPWGSRGACQCMPSRTQSPEALNGPQPSLHRQPTCLWPQATWRIR